MPRREVETLKKEIIVVRIGVPVKVVLVFPIA